MRAVVEALKARIRRVENPYFRALQEGSFERADFIETQIQFLFAVVHFPRPMTVLAARLPHAADRLVLLNNVRDEHGQGDLRQSHETTFIELLIRLGLSRMEIERRAQWPEVRAFNAVLTAVCSHDDVPTALAALGIIEDLFAGIAADIGSGIVARGWLSAGALIHYPTHQELDLDHAEGFYRLIAPVAQEGPRGAYQVEQGLELGAYVFLRLYEDLYRVRQRRLFREIQGPHSCTDGWRVPGDAEHGSGTIERPSRQACSLGLV
jgi:pyrroloquinoline quinone (PQQ) biosynthesis protein C